MVREVRIVDKEELWRDTIGSHPRPQSNESDHTNNKMVS